MAPEKAERDTSESVAGVGSGPPPPHEGPKPTPAASVIAIDFLEVDARLVTLERDSLEYRRHLVKFQDALITQIWTVGVLELVFAVFLAITVWTQYRTKGAKRGSD